MLAHFVERQADFVAYDADLGAPFVVQWQQAIDECGGHLNDETIRDQLQQHTQNVKDAMKACYNKFMDTKYFIRKAFPDDVAVWQAFGFDTFLVTSRRQLELIEFMQVFHSLALDHAAELNTVGYSNADIAEIDTLYEALVEANTAQEAFKGARGTMTEERKLAYNALWAIMQTVNHAARAVYRNSAVGKKLFQLPVPLRKKKVANPQPPS